MTELATLPLQQNTDPSLLGPTVEPYETERGTAFRVMNPHTGEAIEPPSGIKVEIYDEWAAEEVSRELTDLDNFLAGGPDENEESSGTPKPRTLGEAMDRMSNLTFLHMDQARVDAISEHAKAHGLPGRYWSGDDVADKIAQRQISILSTAMPGDGALSHTTRFPQEIITSGALRPKARQDAYRTFTGLGPSSAAALTDQISSLTIHREAKRRAGGDSRHRSKTSQAGLHSLLVHFREGLDYLGSHSVLYYPRATVMDRTPVAMIGGDENYAGGGASGVKSRGDEAHHAPEADVEYRDRFAKVHIELSPDVQESLSLRRQSQDITFMTTTDDPEKAVDFEYPIEDAAIFLVASNISHLISQSNVDVDGNQVIPERVMELCTSPRSDWGEEHKNGIFSVTKFVSLAERVLRTTEAGETMSYSTPEGQVFWESVVADMIGIKSEITEASNTVVTEEDVKRIAETVLLRKMLASRGFDEDWVNEAVFVTPYRNSAFNQYALSQMDKWMKQKGTGYHYIQARAEELQFDQLDLMQQLPDYKRALHA